MPQTRRLVIPLLLVLAITAGIWGAIALADLRPRLGLDLVGGTSVIFRPVNPTGGDPSGEQLDTTVDIIRNRVNATGVAESEVNLEGGNIVVSIPEVRDPDQVIEAVGTTAQLQFRPVLEVVPPNAPKYKEGDFGKVDCTKPDTYVPNDKPDQEVILCGKQPGQPAPDANAPKLRMGKVALAGSEDVSSADAVVGTTAQGVSTGQWQTQLNLTGSGGDKFAKLTGEAACAPEGDPKRQIAIVLDSVVINSPPVASDVQCNVGITGGSAVINGQTQEEAQTLAPLISTGALPLRLEVENRNTVSATLGQDSLRAGLLAGLLGLAVLFVYVVFFYRGLALVIWLGLAIAAALNIGVIFLMGELIGFTLTLAGIAGLIVGVGISADTYVVFFERVKDEVREGATMRVAADRGWRRSFHTLVSANTVSLAAAVVLYLLAVGPVRGFAFTLGLATLIDFCAAWFFGRPAVALLTRFRLFQEGRFVGIRTAV